MLVYIIATCCGVNDGLCHFKVKGWLFGECVHFAVIDTVYDLGAKVGDDYIFLLDVDKIENYKIFGKIKSNFFQKIE